MIDYHSHTKLSYCADRDIDLEFYKKQLDGTRDFESVCITDHGMAIYFPDKVAWAWEYIKDSRVFDKYRDIGNSRLEAYITNLEAYRRYGIYCGLEVELSQDGRLIYDKFYRKRIKPLIGSVHYLFISTKHGFSQDEVVKFWLGHNKQLIESDIDILGHPLRWIAGHVSSISDIYIESIVDMACKNNVAIEFNSHNVTPAIYEADKKMLKIALEKGAKVSFGIDAHKRMQVGKFDYHKKLLSGCGVLLEDLNMLTLKELGLCKE